MTMCHLSHLPLMVHLWFYRVLSCSIVFYLPVPLLPLVPPSLPISEAPWDFKLRTLSCSEDPGKTLMATRSESWDGALISISFLS